MLRARLTAICILLTACQLYAQPHVKDSLLILMEMGIQGKNRVDVLNALAYQYYDYEDSLAFNYAQRALSEATSIEYAKGIKQAYTLIGLGYSSNGEYRTAVSFFQRSDAIEVRDAEEISLYNLMLLGNSYRDRAIFDSALLIYSRAKKIFGKSNLQRLGGLYKNIATVYIRLWQNEKAIKYLDSATSLLGDKPEVYSQMDVWTMYGRTYQNMLQYEKSKRYFDLMCADAFKLDDYYHQIKCLVNKTQLAYDKGEYPAAIRYGLDAVNLLEIYQFPPQQVEVLIEVSLVYIDLGEYDVANKYLLEGLRIADKYGLRFEIASIYQALAWVYKDQNSYELALSYLDKAQKIREEIGDQYGIATCRNIRGLVYYLQKKYSASLDEHEKAKKIRLEINHPLGVSASIFNMSLVYIDVNEIDKALKYQFDAIAIEEKIDSKQTLAISYNFIASLLIKKGRLSEAESYLKKANALAKRTQSKLLLRNNAGYFSDLYEVRKDYKKSLEYKKLYQIYNDSIYREASAVKMVEMQSLYQMEKKDQEIQLLSKETALQESKLEIQASRLRFQLLIIISAVIAILLGSWISFNIYRSARRIRKLNRDISEQNEEIQAQSEELSESNQLLTNLNAEMIEKNEEIQAQSEELMEANQTIALINKNLEDKVEERTTELKQAYKELDTFFYRSSHDFRRPLTTFMGLAEVAKITIKDQNALELFSKVNDTAHYLDKMLIKLQSISDLGGQELVYKEVFLREIFDHVCDTFREDIQRKNIKTSFEIELKDALYSYPALLKIIVENLVENSIFFGTSVDPVIRFKAYAFGNEVVIEVMDNGEGIPPEYQERIFEMYFRANERSKGNGLGLYIVKKAVEKLGGKITVSSKVHQGSLFSVTISGKKV